MMTLVGLLVLALAAVPAALALINLRLLIGDAPRTRRGPTLWCQSSSRLATRKTISPRALDAALASRGVAIEILVMDDGSTDRTAEIVQACASSDSRVRLLAAPSLEPGWTGKIHACHHLSQAARGTHFLFVDADVRLGPDAAAALAGHAQANGCPLVSAVPRQIMGSLGELLTVPTINLMLLGYLPMGLMRRSHNPGLGAACGQDAPCGARAYRRSGGHAAIRHLLHDGIQLARLFRRHGFATDLVPGTISHPAACTALSRRPGRASRRTRTRALPPVGPADLDCFADRRARPPFRAAALDADRLDGRRHSVAVRPRRRDARHEGEPARDPSASVHGSGGYADPMDLAPARPGTAAAGWKGRLYPVG